MAMFLQSTHGQEYMDQVKLFRQIQMNKPNLNVKETIKNDAISQRGILKQRHPILQQSFHYNNKRYKKILLLIFAYFW